MGKRGQMAAWVPIRRQLLDSSVWEADPITRVLWVTILIVASEPGRNGHVDITHRALAARACLTPEQVRKGLRVLMAEDPDSRSKAGGGARLVLIDPQRDWGWRVVNHEKYRSDMRSFSRMVSDDDPVESVSYDETSANGPILSDTVPNGPKRVETSVIVHEKEKEKEKEKERESPSSGRPSRGRFVPPSEEEWTSYARTTWPDWKPSDVVRAFAYYEARNWKAITNWKGAARTCYLNAKMKGETRTEPTRFV